MRVVKIKYQKPANSLIAAIQKHCMLLMAGPEQNGINSLKDLELKLNKFADEQQFVKSKCNMQLLNIISHSTLTQEWYNLIYRGDKLMISIYARPDSYEKAFREYDAGLLSF